MRRREFIAVLGGAAVVWPMTARSQQFANLPTVGFFGSTTQSSWAHWVPAFVQRLRELGWIEGRTVAIDYRWAEGRRERFAEVAAEFVRLKVDVIVTTGAEPVVALKKATAVIPIVFAASGDPVGSGLVGSLRRPGGNVTGLSVEATDLAGKRLELLHEVVPGLRRFAILANVGSGALSEMREVQALADKLGLDAVTLEIRRPKDIALAFEAVQGAEALYVCGDLLVAANRVRIITFALAARLPTIHDHRGHVVDFGALAKFACRWGRSTAGPSHYRTSTNRFDRGFGTAIIRYRRIRAATQLCPSYFETGLLPLNLMLHT
jgi:putative tryptophan/tyrosine transport system substrate-binding protein